MKILKYTIFASAAVALASCSDLNNLQPQGGTILADQVKEINEILPQRAEATYSGMYVKLGQAASLDVWKSTRPDDFAFIMMAFSNDIEGADIVLARRLSPEMTSFPRTSRNRHLHCGMRTPCGTALHQRFSPQRQPEHEQAPAADTTVRARTLPP